MRCIVLAFIALATTPVSLLQAAEPAPDMIYPETRRDTLVETLFGEQIADPYRWLEADVRGSPDTADWVERQNAATRANLDALPQREWFKQRIRGLLDHERFGLPV